MDYKEKYEQALEVAQRFYNNSVAITKKGLEDIFPELAGSEDERIRKRIIDLIKEVVEDDSYHVYRFDEMIAWLEKQGEQKPVISDDALREGIAHFGITQYQIDNWLKKYVDVEKQGEQKSIDNVEPKFKVGNKIKLAKEPKYPAREIIAIKNDDYYFDDAVYLPFSRQDEWELVEQKPWSKEDERIYQSIIDDTVQENQLDTKQIDWLKSLKDRVQTKPKQEWNEEDNAMLISIENILIGRGHSFHDKEINWLKSLRPQSQWKPSKEQIVALRWILNNFPYDSHKEEISGLLEQLKKLRGE